MRHLLIQAVLVVLPATVAVAQPSSSGSVEFSKSNNAVNASAAEEEIIPVTGDIGLSIDASPFLDYAGKLLSDAGATAPTWNYLTQNQTITAKYFLAKEMALRGSFRLGIDNESGTKKVTNRAVTPNKFPVMPAMVDNTYSATQTNFGLAGGIEMRRGYGRLQGFFGGELGVSVRNSSANFTYGNPLTAPNNSESPSIDVSGDDEFAGQGNIATDPFNSPGRIKSRSIGPGFGVGVRGFIGAEYFILPKLSIGGEFGWGIAYVTQGDTTIEVESKGRIEDKDAVGSFKTTQKGTSKFALDSDSLSTVFGPAGRIRMTFHF